MQTVWTYLIVKLDNEKFGLNVDNVIEAIEYEAVTRVPNAQDYIRGITNFRGEILTVVDFRKKIAMPFSETPPNSVIVVLNIEYETRPVKLGIIVDAVHDVAEFRFEEIETLPEIGTRYNTSITDGVVTVNNDFVLLLNLQKIFSSEDISLFQEH